MELDYTSRTEGNLFESVWHDLGMTAVSFGAGYGARKVHDSMYKKGMEMFDRGAKIPTVGFRDPKTGRFVKGSLDTHPLRKSFPAPGPDGVRPDFARTKEAGKLMKSGSAMKASAKSVGTFAKSMSNIGHFFGAATMAHLGFSLGGGLIRAGESFRISREQLERQNYSNMYDQDTYYDTRAAFTQRQRALQVIHNSRLSLRPALGGEANYLHY